MARGPGARQGCRRGRKGGCMGTSGQPCPSPCHRSPMCCTPRYFAPLTQVLHRHALLYWLAIDSTNAHAGTVPPPALTQVLHRHARLVLVCDRLNKHALLSLRLVRVQPARGRGRATGGCTVSLRAGAGGPRVGAPLASRHPAHARSLPLKRAAGLHTVPPRAHPRLPAQHVWASIPPATIFPHPHPTHTTHTTTHPTIPSPVPSARLACCRCPACRRWASGTRHAQSCAALAAASSAQ
jgi:hypothetical protein